MAGESTLDRRATIDGRQPARHSTADNRRPGDNRRPTFDGRATIGLSAVECRMSPGCRLSNVESRLSRLLHVGCRLSHVASLILAFVAFSALAEPAYTNHAGNAIAGWPVALTATHVVLQEGGSSGRLGGTPRPTTNNNPPPPTTYPLSIFPESERRRIAADFGQPRVPVAVKRAITGAEKAMARSRKRAEKGLCTQEESDAFCEKSEAALKNYLDKQVKEGTITPAERKALGR